MIDIPALRRMLKEDRPADVALIAAAVNALPELLDELERLRAVETFAIQIMRHCNEQPECPFGCPFCRFDDGEHEPGELCSGLDDALDARRIREGTP